MDDSRKLVRNNAPTVFQKEGHVPITEVLSVDEALKQLEYMLLDFSAKLMDDPDYEEKIVILSMIQEITLTIADLSNIPQQLIDLEMKERLKKFGGFGNRLSIQGVIWNPEQRDSESYELYMRERASELRKVEP